MIVCHCNIIAEKDLEQAIHALLDADPWQLIVPAKLYRELGKRGRCCGCFPNVVDIIARVTEEYHLGKVSNSAELIDVQERLAALRQQREGGRREGRSTGNRAA
jgi:hypothetical protein